MTTFCFGQKEKGYFIDIMENNVVSNVNNTKWKLEKIIDDKNVRYRGILFKKKRKPRKEEELEISFKDGVITYYYVSTRLSKICHYHQRDERTNEYEDIIVECQGYFETWCVYRLSPQKLVFTFDKILGPVGPPRDIKDITNVGRYIFYRIQ